MNSESKLQAECAFADFSSRSPTINSKAFQPSNDDHMLIQPKKLANPILESKPHASIQKELKLNNKLGVSVLNQKSELTRVYEERQRQQHHQSRQPDEPPKSEFELILERRRKCSESNDVAHADLAVPEFVKAKEKLRKT